MAWTSCLALHLLLGSVEGEAAPEAPQPAPSEAVTLPAPVQAVAPQQVPAESAAARATAALPPAATEVLPQSQTGSHLQAAAEQRRQRGLRFWDLQNFQAAREEFRVAYDLVSRPLFLYNIAVTSMALGDSASAYTYFWRYLREGGDKIPPSRRLIVEHQLQDLADHVATLEIHVDEPGARVFVDGIPLSARVIRVNRGRHSVSAFRRTGQSQTRLLTVEGGQRARVDFDLLALERARSAAVQRTRWLSIGWGATALLATGAALSGLKALNTQRDYEARFASIGTSRSALDQLDVRATRWSVAADAFTAGALLTGSLSLYLTLKRSAPLAPGSASANRNAFDLQLSPRAASVSGTF